jgi:hypothetical protein
MTIRLSGANRQPFSSGTIAYVPGGRPASEYVPSSPVVTVPAGVIWMVTPEMGCSPGEWTRPEIEKVSNGVLLGSSSGEGVLDGESVALGTVVWLAVAVGGGLVWVLVGVALGEAGIGVCVRVAVGGTGVLVGRLVAVRVAAGGTGVSVGRLVAVRVAVGGTGVLVGCVVAVRVAVGGTGVSVAGRVAVRVAVGGTWVRVAVAVVVGNGAVADRVPVGRGVALGVGTLVRVAVEPSGAVCVTVGRGEVVRVPVG